MSAIGAKPLFLDTGTCLVVRAHSQLSIFASVTKQYDGDELTSSLSESQNYGCRLTVFSAI